MTCGKVFKWLKKQGGLEAMKERNERKAKILYDYLDESKLFHGTVRKEDRSIMNVPFVTGDKELDTLFVKEAEAAGFVNLKGHRTVGGMIVGVSGRTSSRIRSSRMITITMPAGPMFF